MVQFGVKFGHFGTVWGKVGASTVVQFCHCGTDHRVVQRIDVNTNSVVWYNDMGDIV